jgi:hypothetical protein
MNGSTAAKRCTKFVHIPGDHAPIVAETCPGKKACGSINGSGCCYLAGGAALKIQAGPPGYVSGSVETDPEPPAPPPWMTGNLVHGWTPVTPDTVKQLSGVCYIAIRNVKMAHRLGRAAGIITAYIGGTPVGAFVDDTALESKTCAMRPGLTGSNVPCLWLESPGKANVTGGAPVGSACPGGLFNELIAPLVRWNLRAALWYQGEDNTDEGTHRSTEEYSCEFKALINTWYQLLSEYGLHFCTPLTSCLFNVATQARSLGLFTALLLGATPPLGLWRRLLREYCAGVPRECYRDGDARKVVPRDAIWGCQPDEDDVRRGRWRRHHADPVCPGRGPGATGDGDGRCLRLLLAHERAPRRSVLAQLL